MRTVAPRIDDLVAGFVSHGETIGMGIDEAVMKVEVGDIQVDEECKTAAAACLRQTAQVPRPGLSFERKLGEDGVEPEIGKLLEGWGPWTFGLHTADVADSRVHPYLGRRAGTFPPSQAAAELALCC
jgi:hypothetical protein